MEKKRSAWHRFIYSQKVAPYVFVLPFIISFILWWIYPMISTVTMSFQDIKPTGAEWVGLKNYGKLLKDTVFHQAIFNSCLYMFLTLVLLIPFPMLFAVLMDSNLVKAKGMEGRSLCSGINISSYFRYVIPFDVLRISNRTDERIITSIGNGTD